MIKLILIVCVMFMTCRGKALDRQISCSTIPTNVLRCIGSPEIIDRSVSSKCTAHMDNQCEFLTCTFREAGWMEGSSKENTEKVNKKKVSEHFDQFAKDHSAWNAAVQALKTKCVDEDLLIQGTYLNCPAYDVMHCVLTNFMKNAGSQWSQSADCQRSKAQIDACPVCPNDCFGRVIPIGSCNACYAEPPAETS